MAKKFHENEFDDATQVKLDVFVAISANGFPSSSRPGKEATIPSSSIMRTSKIEWTESTWNPVTGCTKVAAGCTNCYAERMAKRLRAMGQPNYRDGFKVACHEHALEQPLNWKTPRMIFVNSMSDLFHEDVPDDFIAAVFSVMKRACWHQFQVLTKRDERLMELCRGSRGQAMSGWACRLRTCGQVAESSPCKPYRPLFASSRSSRFLNRWAASAWPEYTG